MLQRAATTLLSRVGAQAEAEALEAAAQLQARNNGSAHQNSFTRAGGAAAAAADDGGSDVGSVVPATLRSGGWARTLAAARPADTETGAVAARRASSSSRAEGRRRSSGCRTPRR